MAFAASLGAEGKRGRSVVYVYRKSGEREYHWKAGSSEEGNRLGWGDPLAFESGERRGKKKDSQCEEKILKKIRKAKGDDHSSVRGSSRGMGGLSNGQPPHIYGRGEASGTAITEGGGSSCHMFGKKKIFSLR